MKNRFFNALNNRLKSSDEHSLKTLLELLASTSKASVCFFATVDEDLNYAKTEVVYAHGKIVPNFTYTLKNTPCMHVLCDEISIFPSDVCNFFPEDILLVQLNIEGYIGAPIFNAEKKQIGILVGLHEETIAQPDEMKELYQIVSVLVFTQFQKECQGN